MILPPSLWPSTPTRAKRLLAFQSSDLFAELPEDVSPFWIAHKASTFVEPQPSEMTVFAGFAFGGPGEQFRGRRLPGSAGFWRQARRLTTGLLMAAQKQEALALTARARKAFLPGPVLDASLSALPPYAELARTRPTAPLTLLRYAAYLNTLAPYLERPQRSVEIGAGAGLLSLGLRRLFGVQAVIVDLPEMLAVVYAVLAHFEGEENVALPNEAGRGLPDTGFVLLVPSQAELIPDASVQIAVNTSSFQEMTYAAIGHYFDLVERVLTPRGLFYCVNEETCSKVEGEPIEFRRYPWREGWETLLDRPFVVIDGAPHRERLVREPLGR